MALVVHPYIMGAPHRLRYFREALQHMQSRPGVLFWTGEQILELGPCCTGWQLPSHEVEAGLQTRLNHPPQRYSTPNASSTLPPERRC